MLSNDLRNAALSINDQLVKVNEGGRISVSWARALQLNLEAMTDQALQLEAQVAPGSPVIDNVVSIAAGKAAAAR